MAHNLDHVPIKYRSDQLWQAILMPFFDVICVAKKIYEFFKHVL